MPGAMTRLAARGWRMTQDGASAPDPVHVAEFACFLGSEAAGWISGQTFQVSGGRVQHIATWGVDRAFERSDGGWTAPELATEVPRLFGAGAKRPEMPPAGWKKTS
jgi:hypothetical protein